MNSTIELIFTIAGALLVILSAYGAATLNRRLFMSGYCFFSILPIIGESMAYNADKAATAPAGSFHFPRSVCASNPG